MQARGTRSVENGPREALPSGLRGAEIYLLPIRLGIVNE